MFQTMASRKQPIRTYERKTAKRFLTSVSFAPQSVLSTENSNPTNYSSFVNCETGNGSTNHDPFETTFDRIAKDAVVPPLPLDTYKNDSWNGSSSDSNISNFIGSSKSPECVVFNPLKRDSISPLTKRIKLIRKCRTLQRYEPKVKVSKKKILKKGRIMSIEDEMQSRAEPQEQKREQKNEVRKKKKAQYKFKKSSRTCNKQTIHHSETRTNLENATLGNSLRDTLKADKTTGAMSSTVLSHIDNSRTTFRYTPNYHKSIKSCIVELDNRVIQNWYMSKKYCEKAMKNEQTIWNDVKRDTFPSRDVISYSTASVSDRNNGNKTWKHIPIKPCSIILYDSIVKCLDVSRNKNSASISIVNETNMSHLTVSNLSTGVVSRCNTNADIVTSDTTQSGRNITKDSYVKIELLDTEKLVKKKDAISSNKNKQGIIFSTPVRCVRPPAYSMLLSPITNTNANTHDKSNSRYENRNSTMIIEKDASVVALADKSYNVPERCTRSFITLEMSEHCGVDANVDTQKQTMQVLSTSRKVPVVTDTAIKAKAIFASDESIHTALTQDYNAVHDAATSFQRVSNISLETDRSRSLFSDVTHNRRHSSAKDTVENEGIHGSTQADINAVSLHPVLDSSVTTEQLSNDNTYTRGNSKHISSRQVFMPIETRRGSADNFSPSRQTYEDQGEESMEITTELVGGNSKDDIVRDNKDSLVEENRDNVNAANDVHMLLTRLQDSVRITDRRMRHPKWHLSMWNTSEKSDDRSAMSKNTLPPYHVANVAHSDVSTTTNDIEYPKGAVNSSLDYSQSLDKNDAKIQVKKSLFLKPGKSWARSLSILSNINVASDLDKLSVGKGKRWRHSVRNILDMQEQETCRSYRKQNQDNRNPSCAGLDASSLNHNECKMYDSVNRPRLSKRVSVRVVPNGTSSKCNVKDTSFLEAFGITRNNSLRSKASRRKKSLFRDIQHDDDNGIVESHRTTARDVVLQRCSQESYQPFAECFPDSYLKNCRKIGEGVYGEVFLYDGNEEKSVIKIIPIEGAELVNGERQKKFSEILSEIIIAKELHNLRSHATHQTSGFVEVRSIKCIIGKYPERLVELWNIYDNDKTSDNDSPSMFSENQLYIALELSHGGEDLEAFVFQSAQEAHALFLQTALALAVAEKALEFEHRDLHWGNILISRTKESSVRYNLDGKEIRFPSNGVQVSIIDFTLSRMSYQDCCIYNDLASDPALFTAHGEYQFEIYRLMRDKIQNNWRKFEPYTNVLWLHYTLDKMITAVRYRKKKSKAHKHVITELKELKDTILKYDSAFDFVTNSNSIGL